MSTLAVSSVNSALGGERRILKATPVTATVPAASSTTDAPVAPDALLEVWENGEGAVYGLRADGRVALLVQATTPAVLHDNDVWIELVTGAPALLYRHAGTTYVLGGGSSPGPGGSGLSLPCLTNGLQKGIAVRTLVSSGMKCDIAGVGAGSLSAGGYRAVGVLNADVTDTVTPVEILLSGMRIDLTGAQINFLTGGTSGVLVPTQRYFLSAAGRWSSTPLLEPSAEVVMPLGVAMTTSSLQVQLGPAVIL
jgi:hypothetical protein